MPVSRVCSSHLQEMIGRPYPGDPHIEIIAGNRAGPWPESAVPAPVQCQHPHPAASLLFLKCGFLFFSERSQFARAARNYLF